MDAFARILFFKSVIYPAAKIPENVFDSKLSSIILLKGIQTFLISADMSMIQGDSLPLR